MVQDLPPAAAGAFSGGAEAEAAFRGGFQAEAEPMFSIGGRGAVLLPTRRCWTAAHTIKKEACFRGLPHKI